MFTKVESAVLALPGVLDCSVNGTTGRTRIKLAAPALYTKNTDVEAVNRSAPTGARDVIRAVEDLGYDARVIDLGGNVLTGVKRLQEVCGGQNCIASPKCSRLTRVSWPDYFLCLTLTLLPRLICQ